MPKSSWPILLLFVSIVVGLVSTGSHEALANHKPTTSTVVVLRRGDKLIRIHLDPAVRGKIPSSVLQVFEQNPALATGSGITIIHVGRAQPRPNSTKN